MFRLNINPKNLFVRTAMDDLPAGADVGVDFVEPGSPMPKDYMDTNGIFTQEFAGIQQQQRADQASQYDRDNDNVTHPGNPNLDPNMNPAQQVGPYAYLERAASQSKGFLNKQARKNFTLGVVASLENDTLEGGRVTYKSPTRLASGTVIAVGDAEFAVIWDDKTASVERKSDYELMIKG